MAIKFLCPNGHPLACRDDRAGTPGKCPKCGTKFVVPNAEEIAAAASNGAQAAQEALAGAAVSAGSGVGGEAATAGSPSSVGRSTAVTPGVGGGSAKGASAPEDMIVFLCPNGHRLNGPKHLQGRPGQCPHCGEKFRIPVYDEEPEEEDLEEFPSAEVPEEEEIPVGTAVESDPNAESEAVETFPEEVEIVEMFEEAGSVSSGGLAAAVSTAIPPLPPGPSHQLFEVFSRLWSLRPEGTAVELVLKDGKVVAPIKFSPALSRQALGVFATQEESGSFRLIVIPWDAVARVDFHQVEELPPGVFS